MVKRSSSRSMAKVFIHLVFIVFCLLCILPLFSIISTSFSSESDIIHHGYQLIPFQFTTAAYKYIFLNPGLIFNAYTVTISVTVLGTILSLAIISMIAYALSRPDFRYRNIIAVIVAFTMLFNGGMVPWYIIVSNVLMLKNTFWVLILPYLANAWFILLLRTFFQKIPISLIESVKLDGAGELRIFLHIIIPLSTPGLATIALFIALQYWNDWYLAFMFIQNQHLVPLQYMLSNMLNNITYLTQNASVMPGGLNPANMPRESARMAMCLLAAGPMLFVFPFFQKYFVQGLTVGSIKG